MTLWSIKIFSLVTCTVGWVPWKTNSTSKMRRELHFCVSAHSGSVFALKMQFNGQQRTFTRSAKSRRENNGPWIHKNCLRKYPFGMFERTATFLLQILLSGVSAAEVLRINYWFMTVSGQAGSSESKLREKFVSLENFYRALRRNDCLVEAIYRKPGKWSCYYF